MAIELATQHCLLSTLDMSLVLVINEQYKYRQRVLLFDPEARYNALLLPRRVRIVLSDAIMYFILATNTCAIITNCFLFPPGMFLK